VLKLIKSNRRNKLKIFKIVLLILLLTVVHAKNAKWQKLKPLNTYKGNAYNLKENVAYMEIRGYKTKKSKKASETLALYKKPLKSYPDDMISKFRALTPKYSTKADIGSNGNAFFIDTEGKIFQMDMKKDIVSLLGTINTPAEVQLVLSLNYEDYGRYVRKTSKGYQVKSIDQLKGCTSLKRVVFVDKLGNYSSDYKYTLLRKGCKKRKHTQFIKSKKMNYSSYTNIALDDNGNLYLVGYGSTHKNEFHVLEKYTNKGKRVWSRKLKGYTSNLVVENGLVYVFDDKKLKVTYRLNGKKKSSGKVDAVSVEEKNIGNKKYFPEGLPDKKELTDFYLLDYVKDKRGNIYIVGSEVFYPSGSPDDIPTGECGNVESVEGALVAKLDSKGKTVWAKVVDRND